MVIQNLFDLETGNIFTPAAELVFDLGGKTQSALGSKTTSAAGVMPKIIPRLDGLLRHTVITLVKAKRHFRTHYYLAIFS